MGDWRVRSDAGFEGLLVAGGQAHREAGQGTCIVSPVVLKRIFEMGYVCCFLCVSGDRQLLSMYHWHCGDYATISLVYILPTVIKPNAVLGLDAIWFFSDCNYAITYLFHTTIECELLICFFGETVSSSCKLCCSVKTPGQVDIQCFFLIYISRFSFKYLCRKMQVATLKFLLLI